MSILENSQLMHMVTNVSPAGLLVADAQGKIVFVNQQALLWLGYAEEDLIGQSVDVLLPEEARTLHATHRKRYAAKPRARAMAEEQELFARKKDGTEFPVDISLHPFQHEGERYVLANLLDATQRRAAAMVPQERLNAIGEMVAGLAHESRNALQRARASLDLLELDFEGDTEQMELARRIRRSLEDLEHNYDEVRNYAAPINLDFTEIDVLGLVKEVLQDLEAEFPLAKSVEVQGEGGLSNFADRFRLKQVIRNCIENAIQASSADEFRVCVRVGSCEGRKSWQMLEIIDAGEGLADGTAEQIFEPFFTTKQKGTGLGLAICRRIMDAHGGAIFAAPNPSEGTTVTIQIPCRH